MKILKKDQRILFNYLRPSYFFFFLSFFFTFVGIESLRFGVSLFFFCFLFVIPFSIWLIANLCRLVATLTKVKASGLSSDLLHDFKEGLMIGCDQMRMGDTYIIGRRTCSIIRYDEIKEIYNWILVDNGQWRELRVKTTDGKERTICHHTTDELSDAEMLEIYNFIHNKNPQVRWTSHPHPLHFKGDQE